MRLANNAYGKAESGETHHNVRRPHLADVDELDVSQSLLPLLVTFAQRLTVGEHHIGVEHGVLTGCVCGRRRR